MNDTQRRRYERGLRVRDFAETVKDSFPAKSKGAQSISRVGQLLENLSAPDASHATNRRAAQAGTSGKKEAREQLRAMLSRLNRTARAAGLDDPSLKERFRLPATNPNSQALLATARSFHEEATTSKSRLADFGLTDDFLDALNKKIEDFEGCAAQQNTGESERKAAKAAIDAALDDLDAEITRLDAIISNTLADDPPHLAAWESAKRLEQAPRKAGKSPTPAPARN
jgi:predicted RNase H-like HicB family nuclease